MDSVTGWTGRLACALQAALRMTNEAFAAHLGIGVRTVASWHQKPTLQQSSELQQVLDTTLEQTSPSVQARFAKLAAGMAEDDDDETAERNRFAGSAEAPVVQVRDVHGDVLIGPGDTADSRRPDPSSAAARRLGVDPNISAALDWLDGHAGWEPGSSRREVAALLARLDVRELRSRGVRRGRVDRRRVAHAMHEYYGGSAGSHGRYSARFADDEVETSVLTCPEWLDLECPLVAAHDRLTMSRGAADVDLVLDDEAAQRAVQRIAEVLVTGARLIDMPLYRLLEIKVSKGMIAGSVGITRFVEYAVTMDLLEGELLDALAADAALQPGALPLRDRYLPDVASVIDVGNRLCAGGTLALCAIARPASLYRGEADYLLLVQERSGHVLNAARRLAVIPKAFHQPMTDFRTDTQIGATLRREMEEELFGREETDNTVADQRLAGPMHPSRMTEPMRWLMGDPNRLRMECTGFGLNLVSGNLEFPGLIVVEDEEFWDHYGGQVEANWESEGLSQYSSLDREGLAELVHDVAWSNEGLFALLQGIRRLREIGGDRVDLPEIEWEVR
jgi:hypothetical protein